MRKRISIFDGMTKEQVDGFYKADLQTRIDGMKSVKNPSDKKESGYIKETKKAS